MDKSAAKPAELDKSAAKPAELDKSAAKPAELDKSAAKPAEVDKSAAKPAEMAALIASLDTTDVRKREAALDAIGSLGPAGLSALDALLAAAADPNPIIRWHAARSIGMVGETALPAMPKLIALLEDADPVVITQAAHAIGQVRGDAAAATLSAEAKAASAAAIEPLINATLHADPRVRRAAILALRMVSTPDALLPLVTRHLADADPTVVLPALHTLADMGVESLPFLAKALAEPGSRYWATVVLAEMGPAAAPALPQLIALAGDAELDERLQAIYALAGIGEAAADAVPVLVAALEGNEPLLRFAAAHALGRIKAAAADEALAKAAADDNPLLAEVASWARARIAPDDATLVDAALARLEEGLAANDPGIRAASISGLADLAQFLDEPRRQMIAGLAAQSLGDPADAVSLKAGNALVQLGPAAIDAVKALLADAAMRPQALEVLAAMGESAKAALPEIGDALDSQDPRIRAEAAYAVGSLGPEAAALVPRLADLLADDEAPEVRYTSAYALGRIGSAAGPAFERLVAISKSADALLATVAIWAALKIRPDDGDLFAQAVPLLEEALDSERELVRLEAAVSLGEIGSPAAAAVPALELVAASDPVERVRDAATHAIALIRPR